ncbi:MAG: aldehyde ferredoxin oxidoreductase C-terminal domain-containing protein [Chloroflexota bacterium]
MLKGYMGKLLRVDLTSRKIEEEALPADGVVKQYVGCWGLGLSYLYKECQPGTAAADPGNPLIFFTGPFTGTRMPGGNNTTLATLNFDTGFTVGRSHTHAFFGPYMKAAGYDGLIVTGKADTPVYLWIHDGKTEIRDAKKFWGRDSHDTEDLVKEDLGVSKASVAAIGPGGENLCAGAMICNDKNHSFSHSGVGGVMGSKNLKAIAVWGTAKVPLSNEEKEKQAADRWRQNLNYGPLACINFIGFKGKEQRRSKYEEHSVRRYGGICALNFKAARLPGFVADATNKLTARGCYRCPIQCSYDMKIVSGPHKGYVATMGGGGEQIEGAGSILGVIESGNVFYLVDLFDRLGLEGSTVGCTLAMAFEAYERGLITKADTDGLELKWGDAEVVEKLLRKYASREGFGDILAKGPRAAAEIIGQDAPNFSVHVKGSGINLHDWRHGWGTLLGQIVSSGAGWPGAGADVMRAEPDAGFPTTLPPFDPKTKPAEVRGTNIIKSINDSTGMCSLNANGNPNILSLTSQGLGAITGWEPSREELFAAGERMVNLERAFNMRHGLVPEDDYIVSERLVESPPDGPGKGHTIKPYLKGMVHEYYRLMGWDEKTGKPWPSTLKRLRLDHVAKDLWE